MRKDGKPIFERLIEVCTAVFEGDINVEGIEDEVTPEIMDKLLAVDKDLWTAEIAEMRRYYNEDIAAKGGNVPAALMAELDKIEARLNA